MEIKDIKLNVFQSLQGHIDKDVRGIGYRFYNNKMEIYVYLDRKPNENDYEIINQAITEMMANDLDIKKQKIEIIETHEPIGKLNFYDSCVFCRYENNF